MLLARALFTVRRRYVAFHMPRWQRPRAGAYAFARDADAADGAAAARRPPPYARR